MALAGAIYFSELHFLPAPLPKRRLTSQQDLGLLVFPHKSEIFARSEMDFHNHVLFLFGPVVIYLTAST